MSKIYHQMTAAEHQVYEARKEEAKAEPAYQNELVAEWLKVEAVNARNVKDAPIRDAAHIAFIQAEKSAWWKAYYAENSVLIGEAADVAAEIAAEKAVKKAKKDAIVSKGKATRLAKIGLIVDLGTIQAGNRMPTLPCYNKKDAISAIKAGGDAAFIKECYAMTHTDPLK